MGAASARYSWADQEHRANRIRREEPNHDDNAQKRHLGNEHREGKPIQKVGTGGLKRHNDLSIAQGYNRYFCDRFFRDADPRGVHIISVLMIHEHAQMRPVEPHYRCMVLAKIRRRMEPVLVFLDLPILSPRSTYRFNCERALSAHLEEKGALVDVAYMPGRRRQRHTHPSELVRRICTIAGIGIHWPGADIFLIAYFEKHRKLGTLTGFQDSHEIRKWLQSTGKPDDTTEDESGA